MPPQPYREGYTFIGWYKNEDCTTKVEFPYTLSSDDTWYAKWIVTPYTVNASDVTMKSGSITSYNYSGSNAVPTNIRIPDTLDGQLVTSIGSSAFSNKELTSIVIPEGIKSIGNSAFSTNQLKGVYIPSSVMSIGANGFSNNNLKKVMISEGVQYIGESAFYLNQLKSVTFPNSVISIGEGAFASNQIESVKLPNKITNIGVRAFCENQITSVVIPTTVTQIDQQAFYKNKLESIVIPNNVTTIGYKAFGENVLTNVEVPENVTNIKNCAFEKNQLQSILIQNGEATLPELVLWDQIPPKGFSAFLGWYEKNDFSGEPFDFTTKRANGITLYAKYEKASYTICLNENGGDEVSNITQDSGTTIDTAPLTTSHGYTFDGWYEEEEYTTPVLFPYTVEDNDTWYAKWNAVSTGGDGSGDSGDSGDSGSSSGSSSSSSKNHNTNIVKGSVGESHFNVGEKQTIYNDGQTETTVKIGETVLKNQVNKAETTATISIPVKGKTDVARAQLNVQDIKNMQEKELVLEVKTDNYAYELPTNQVNIESISEKIGKNIKLTDITFSVIISETKNQMVKVVEAATKEEGLAIVIPPVDFEVEAVYNGKTCKVTKFNQFVERMIAIPSEVAAKKITTAIVTDSDGSIRHIPTQVTKVNGRYYAKVNSLTNSNYTLISNQVTFKDIETHWAKEAITDMGERLVLNGVGNENFEPNREITRAEFATIMIKALGLKPELANEPFHDIQNNAWYADYIAIASEYGIISGFGDGNFKPSNKITRQQAMTIIERTMKITGLKIEMNEETVNQLLEEYRDSNKVAKWARNSIAACMKAGIVSGKGNAQIAPGDNITRGEVAVMIQRMLQKSKLI